MCGAARRGTDALPWSETRSRMKGARRKLGDLRVARNRDAVPGRAGKPEEGNEPAMHGPEKSSARIVPMKPPNKVARRSGGGGGGGKACGRGEGEQLDTIRTPRRDVVSHGLSRPRAGAVWAAQAPMPGTSPSKVGTGCGKAASPGLCGGRGVTCVPTAPVGKAIAPRPVDRAAWKRATNSMPGQRSYAKGDRVELRVLRVDLPLDKFRPACRSSGRSPRATVFPLGMGLIVRIHASRQRSGDPVLRWTWGSSLGIDPPGGRCRQGSVSRQSTHRPERLDSRAASMNFIVRAPSSTVTKLRAAGSGFWPRRRATIASAASA